MGQLVCNPSNDQNIIHTLASDDAIAWHDLVIAAGNAVGGKTSNVIYCPNIKAGLSSGLWRILTRVGFIFDTSSIPETDTISSATFQIKGEGKSDGIGIAHDICVYSFSPAADDEFVTADYTQFGTTPFSNAITYDDFNVETYNIFTLNAAGLAAISKTGNTRLGVRNSNYDVADELDPNNHNPVWKANAESEFTIYTVDSVGNEPILTVNYGPPSEPGLNQKIFIAARNAVWR